MRSRLIVCILLALLLLSGCAMAKMPGGYDYKTLGIAEVEVCHRYEGREDKLVERCDRVSTDAFSGWEAIMNGAAKAIIKVLTMGLAPV